MMKIGGSSQAGQPAAALWVLASVCLATGTMVAFVICISPTLTLIQRDLGAGFSELQWVLSGYVLAQGALLVLGGSLGDLFGHRRIYIPAMALFTLGLFLCAAVSSVTVLIGLAVLLGAVSALALGNALTLVAFAFAPVRRSWALATWGVGLVSFYALAPLFAGFAGEHLSWRATFVVLGCLAALSAGAACRGVGSAPSVGRRAFDVPGALLLTVGTGSLVAALIEGNHLGWTSAPVLGAVGAGVAALVAFVWWERRAPAPMLDLAILSEPRLRAAALATVAMSAGFYANVFYLPIYFSESLDASPTEAVVMLLAVTGTGVLASLVTVWLRGRISDRALIVAALALMAGGTLLEARIEPDGTFAALLPGLVLFGWGLGTFSGPAAALVARAAGEARSGVANATVYTCRLIGSVLGIAGLGAILQAQIGAELGATPGADRAAAIESIASGDVAEAALQLPAAARSAFEANAYTAFVDGVGTIFLVLGLGLVAAALITTVLLYGREPSGPD